MRLFFTWTIEPSSSRDVEHGTRNSEQYPPTIFTIELDERAWGIRGEEDGGRMGAWHP